MGETENVERRACPDCCEMIAVDAKVCRFCGSRFDEKGDVAVAEAKGDATGGLIPYKNTSALIAYYLGVFSIIPCFAIGVAALVLGIKGLKYAKEHPEARGQVHAWIGIIAGGLFGLLYILLTLLFVAVAATSKRGW